MHVWQLPYLAYGLILPSCLQLHEVWYHVVSAGRGNDSHEVGQRLETGVFLASFLCSPSEMTECFDVFLIRGCQKWNTLNPEIQVLSESVFVVV